VIICHDPKFVYYAPPKTGSKSLGRIFEKKGWIADQGGKHDITPPPDARGYFYLITVRNPFSRYVSFWRHYQKKTFPEGRWPPGQKQLHQDVQGMSFRDFAAKLDWSKYPDSVRLQTLTAYRDVMPWAHQVIHLERFAQEVRQLPFLEDDVKIPHENHRIHVPWQSLYDKEAADYVVEHFREDFARFGYSPQDR
jgi:hypothetical protein